MPLQSLRQRSREGVFASPHPFFEIIIVNVVNAMTAQASSQTKDPEHYPDANAAKIQNAIAVLSEMESKMDELSSQVSEMKRKLVFFAESEAEETKNQIVDSARKEADQAIEAVRMAANKDAEEIRRKGDTEAGALRRRVASKLSKAVELVVNAVESV